MSNWIQFAFGVLWICGAMILFIQNSRLRRENKDLQSRLLAYRLAHVKVPPAVPVPGMHLEIEFVNPGFVPGPVPYLETETGNLHPGHTVQAYGVGMTGTVYSLEGEIAEVVWSDGHKSKKHVSILVKR